MKTKIKKYIYPIVFSIGVVAFAKIAGLIDIITTREEGLLRLGIALFILFALFLVALIIYCIKRILKNKTKIKKYIYPFIFSIVFIVFWITVVLTINATTSNDGYGGLGLGILILFAWLFIVLPIYCIRYSKIIIDEKLKFLFPFYNAFVLSFFYILPFSFEDETYIYSSILFVWVVLWTLIPLLIRLNPTKKQDDNNLSETENSVTKV